MRKVRLQITYALVVGAALTLCLAATATLAQPNVDDITGTDGDGEGVTNVPQNGDPSLTEVLDDPAFNTGVLIGVAGTIGIALLSLLFLGGTKFVNSENVLDNDARRSIYEYIKDNPGVHLRATATALELSTTNVLWHLRKLESANLVNSRKFEGYKLFYPTEGGRESQKRAVSMAVLKNENAVNILTYAASNPGAHQREIARALDVNHGTIRWHLRKLNEADLVVQIKKEHTSNYFISSYGAEMLGEVTGNTFQAPALPEEFTRRNEPARPGYSGGRHTPPVDRKVDG